MPLDDPEKVSPQLILDWTFMAEMQITLQSYQEQLAYEPPKAKEGEEEAPETTKEYKEMLAQYIEEIKVAVIDAVK